MRANDQRLLEAAETGNMTLAEQLLDEQAVSPFAIDAAGHTALHKAAFMGFDNLARLLLSHEASLVDACDITQSTPLHVAAFAGNANLSVTLLGARASVSAVDIGGNTPRAHLWHSIPSQE